METFPELDPSIFNEERSKSLTLLVDMISSINWALITSSPAPPGGVLDDRAGDGVLRPGGRDGARGAVRALPRGVGA